MTATIAGRRVEEWEQTMHDLAQGSLPGCTFRGAIATWNPVLETWMLRPVDVCRDEMPWPWYRIMPSGEIGCCLLDGSMPKALPEVIR